MIKTKDKIEEQKNRFDFNDESTTVKMDGTDTGDRTFAGDRQSIGVRQPVLTDDNPGELIFAAFTSNSDWRTVGGISRATGLSFDTVKAFLDDNEILFEKTPFKVRGRTLYSLKSLR